MAARAGARSGRWWCGLARGLDANVAAGAVAPVAERGEGAELEPARGTMQVGAYRCGCESADHRQFGERPLTPRVRTELRIRALVRVTIATRDAVHIGYRAADQNVCVLAPPGRRGVADSAGRRLDTAVIAGWSRPLGIAVLSPQARRARRAWRSTTRGPSVGPELPQRSKKSHREFTTVPAPTCLVIRVADARQSVRGAFRPSGRCFPGWLALPPR